MTRFVYQFGAGVADGRADQKALLGGKGAGLAEMTSLGIPVPPGFTLTTEVCTHYHDNEHTLPTGLKDQVVKALASVGDLSDSSFGDPEQPLLVSVRSGAAVSMPGMMDTILNLGLNDQTVGGLVSLTGDERFAYDCYRRFVAMYGEVVLGMSEDGESPFARILDEKKAQLAIDADQDLTAEHLQSLVTEFKIEILRQKNTPFPEDPSTQLWGAIGAVLRSWNNPRAQVYRRLHNIAAGGGTAVNVQAMVFGNLGADSGSGVCFTRNPSSGEPGIFGEYLINAQGEDVVAGTRTPQPIDQLQTLMPEVFTQLGELCQRLERHFVDMQDLEFTIQSGKLWLLQTRTGKRTGRAMVRIAVDMVAEELIDQRTAVQRVVPNKLEELLHPGLAPNPPVAPLTKGLPASPGAAIGRVVFTATDAEAWAQRGESVILVRQETSPEDIHGMKAAAGILTARGGMTSHAAVVARGMGKCCVTGCKTLTVDVSRDRFSHGAVVVKKGDTITIDGSTGAVYTTRLPLVPARMTDEFATLMAWVDEHRRLRVRTNADTPADASTARAFGAEGIGLCRTEHMFFAPERLLRMREMILADTPQGRRQALAHILPMQRTDFVEIFRAMAGLPVTIRLLDPPLHEFLPRSPTEVAELAAELATTTQSLSASVAGLAEQNPMLGHRGCRLAISYPEIYETQAQAIAEAAVQAKAENIDVQPEIMIPFVSTPVELKLLRESVCRVMDQVFADAQVSVAYAVGTMIELPRACVIGDQIAAHADFFSFGTNDLTQTTYGFSRDDASRWLECYLDREVLSDDPFVTLDCEGVGSLIRIGVEKGRANKTKLKIGICGEHGGDPASVEFCHREGLDYVSCSPFRVPIARLAAAQAALRRETRSK